MMVVLGSISACSFCLQTYRDTLVVIGNGRTICEHCLREATALYAKEVAKRTRKQN